MHIMSRRHAVASIGSLTLATLAPPVFAGPVNKIINAKPFAQTKNWSCWAAAAVILMRWKNGVDFSESDVAAMAGQNYVDAFNADTGLLGTQFADFAKKLGLRTEAPQNYTPGGYESLLSAHGPLWIGAEVTSAGKPRRHVRVLRGISGDGTFDGSTVWVLDPDGGTDTQMSVTKFSKEMEKIAREELDAGHDLFSQVIRFS